MNGEDSDDENGVLYFLPGGIADDSPPRRSLDVPAPSPLANSFGAIGHNQHLNSFRMPSVSDEPNNFLLSGLGGVAVPNPSRERDIGGFGGLRGYGLGSSTPGGIGSIGSSIGSSSAYQLNSDSPFGRPQSGFTPAKSSTTGTPLRAPPGLDAPAPYERNRPITDDQTFGFMNRLHPSSPSIAQEQRPLYRPPGYDQPSNMELAELNTTSVVVTQGKNDHILPTNTIGVHRFRSFRKLSDEYVPPPSFLTETPPKATTPMRRANSSRAEKRHERKDLMSSMKRSSTLGSPSSISSRDSEDHQPSAPASPFGNTPQRTATMAPNQIRIKQHGKPKDSSPKKPESIPHHKGSRATTPAAAASSTPRRPTPVYREKLTKQTPETPTKPERSTPRRTKSDMHTTAVEMPPSSPEPVLHQLPDKKSKKTVPNREVDVPKTMSEVPAPTVEASTVDHEQEQEGEAEVGLNEEFHDARASLDVEAEAEAVAEEELCVAAADEQVEEDIPIPDSPNADDNSSAVESNDDASPPEETGEVVEEVESPVVPPAPQVEIQPPSSEDDMKPSTSAPKKKADKKGRKERDNSSSLKHVADRKKSENGPKKKDNRKEEVLVEDDPLFTCSSSPSSTVSAWKDSIVNWWQSSKNVDAASRILSWFFVHLHSLLSLVLGIGVVMSYQLLTYGLKFHRLAVRGLVFNRNIASCFAFLYAFPLLVQYVIPWAPPWAPVCLWYAFLVQLFCTQGSTAMVATFRILLPLVFLVEGVSHHSFLLDLNGAELLLISFILSAVKTGNLYSPVFFLSLSAQCLSAVFLGSELIVQWVQLAVALYSLHAMASGDDDWNGDDEGTFGHSPLLGDMHQPSGTSIQKTKHLDRRSLATVKGRKPRTTLSI
ncbi:unnamed protein product [Aphanomyces euteiches]